MCVCVCESQRNSSSHCDVDDGGWQLFNNKIGNRGAEAISEAFAFSGTLTLLDLQKNLFGRDGCIAISDAVLCLCEFVFFYLLSDHMSARRALVCGCGCVCVCVSMFE